MSELARESGSTVPHLLLLGAPSWIVGHLTGLPIRLTALQRPADTEPGAAMFLDRAITIDFVEDPRIMDVIRALHAADPFDAVLPLDEYAMALASDICGQLSLAGDPTGAWGRSRHKLRCRERLAAAGLPAVRHAPVGSADALREFVMQAGPAIVKPMSGGGSEGVSLLNDAEEAPAAAAFERARDADAAGEVIAEEYLRGQEVSVETLSTGGKHQVIGITQKAATGPPLFVEVGHLFPAPLDARDRDRIGWAAADALTAIGLENGPAHTEVIVTPGQVQVVEVNARLGGGLIWELVEIATGLDLARLTVASLLGWPVDTTPVRGLTAAVRFLTAPATGVLARLAGRFEAAAAPGVVRTGTWAQPDHAVHSLRGHADRVGYAIAVGANADEADTRAQAALDCLRWEWTVRVD